MSRTWKLAAICACLVAVVIVSPSGVLAHETREVDGYQLVVGWVVEPVFLGEKNGLDLQVRLPAEEGSAPTPVEGLQNTLQAQVLFGGQTRDLELRPVFRQPGRYAADVAPTREGDYRFRVFGTIEGLEVDETFDSADGGFDGVRSIRDIQFPENLPPLADISRTNLHI